jgi:hypothetical protein
MEEVIIGSIAGEKLLLKDQTGSAPTPPPPLYSNVFFFSSLLYIKEKHEKGSKLLNCAAMFFLIFHWENLFRPSFLGSVIEIIQRQLLLPPTPVLCCAMNAERKHFDKFMRMLPAAGIDSR